MDNKTLRTHHSLVKCAIIVKRDGVDKYISKDYFHKHAFQYTVKLNKAMMFEDVYKADRFIEDNNIEGRICGVEMKMKVVDYDM